MRESTGCHAIRWWPLPLLLLLACLLPGCAPDGPLGVDDGDENRSDDGDGGGAAATIVRQALAGSSANYDGATSVSLRSYDHPGGHLIVFVRHGGVEIGGITCTFDGQELPRLASTDAGPRSEERAGYVFGGEVEAGRGDIVVELREHRRQRGIMAFSVDGSAGVRATATRGVSDPGADGSVSLLVPSEEDDLVLGYVAWLFSIADVASQGSGQTTELEDEEPTRQHAHSKRGAAGTTSLSVTFRGDPSSTVYLAVSLEPLSP